MQVLRAEVPAGYQAAGTTLGGLLVLHQASINYAKMVRFRRTKKTCFLCFFEGLWLEKITKKQKNTSLFLHFKTKKTQGTQNKNFFWGYINQKVSSKFCFCFFCFEVLRFWGYCHSLHITSFQIYQDNKQGLYYLCVCLIYICMCVLKDMIQEALRCISGGYHIYIYIYIYSHQDSGKSKLSHTLYDIVSKRNDVEQLMMNRFNLPQRYPAAEASSNLASLSATIEPWEGPRRCAGHRPETWHLNG